MENCLDMSYPLIAVLVNLISNKLASYLGVHLIKLVGFCSLASYLSAHLIKLVGFSSQQGCHMKVETGLPLSTLS